MLEGLAETSVKLANRGVKLVALIDEPVKLVARLARHAAYAVTDRGYLRVERAWRLAASREVRCPFAEVDTNIVVPVEEASDHAEYSAATFRPRVTRKLANYMVRVHHRRPAHSSMEMRLTSLDLADVDEVMRRLRPHPVTDVTNGLRGGVGEAGRLLKRFLSQDLARYHDLARDPAADATSHLSAYLHFGQISPLQTALKVASRSGPGADAYLEQLVVRRELAINMCWFDSHYNEYRTIPEWARRTLARHVSDNRKYLYSGEDLEAANTHDPYWNTAQIEMVTTGRMHNYMRMYWGKKIMEWSRTPEEAHAVALALNDKYEIDGNDPNGFAGVAWCFGKHDRPWKERPVFGMVRYMNAAGLDRKFDMGAYVERVCKA
jgi:deoxyribodipyrimidine photo-lyase